MEVKVICVWKQKEHKSGQSVTYVKKKNVDFDVKLCYSINFLIFSTAYINV